MSLLNKLFPISFRGRTVSDVIISIIIYLVFPAVLGLVAGIVNWLIGGIPAVGALVSTILNFVTSIAGIYCFVGIVVTILNYFNLLDK